MVVENGEPRAHDRRDTNRARLGERASPLGIESLGDGERPSAHCDFEVCRAGIVITASLTALGPPILSPNRVANFGCLRAMQHTA